MQKIYKGLIEIRKEYKERFITFATKLRDYGALIPGSIETEHSVTSTLTRFGNENSSKKITLVLNIESGIVIANFAMSSVIDERSTATKKEWSITFESFSEASEEELREYVESYMNDKFKNNVF